MSQFNIANQAFCNSNMSITEVVMIANSTGGIFNTVGSGGTSNVTIMVAGNPANSTNRVPVELDASNVTLNVTEATTWAVSGITNGLPSGANTIGNIGTVTTLTNGLPSGANTIGAVSSIVTGLPTGANTLGYVNLNVNGSTVSNSNPIPICDAYLPPAVASWTSATAVNTTAAVNTNGYDTVIVTIVSNASATSGQVIFEVYDGVNWLPIKAPTIIDYTTVGIINITANYSKGFQVPVAGFPQFRTRLSTVLPASGTLSVTTIVSSAPDVSLVTVGLDPAQALPTGTNFLGNTSITALPAIPTGTNIIGKVNLSATTTGGAPNYYPVITAATNNAALVKASAGQIQNIVLSNNSAVWAYLKIYNKATTPVPGTDTPVAVYGIAPSGQTILQFDLGLPFTTGIGYAITLNPALADNTVLAAGSTIVGTINYN